MSIYCACLKAARLPATPAGLLWPDCSRVPAPGGVAEAGATSVVLPSHPHVWRCQAHAGAADSLPGVQDQAGAVAWSGVQVQANVERAPTMQALTQPDLLAVCS
jgi:hypothetical protein